MTPEERYIAAKKALKAAQKELEDSKQEFINNAPYKVGDKVLVFYRGRLTPGFVTEVKIGCHLDLCSDNFFTLTGFEVRKPKKDGTMSLSTSVYSYFATVTDLQPFVEDLL